MKQYLFILLFTAGAPFVLCSQQYCKTILDQADSAFKADRLKEALLKLEDAESCDYKNALIKERQKLRADIFNKIEQQRQEAIAISIKSDSFTRLAWYNLAQLFEEKTTAALEKGAYEQAWLYNQEALRMAAASRWRMPLSAGRLMLREMCPCPELRVPKPDTMQGSIVALAYDQDGRLNALEVQVLPSDSSKNNDQVRLSVLKPGDGVKPLTRVRCGEALPALSGQSMSDKGQFISLHHGQLSTDKFLAKWPLPESNIPAATSIVPLLEATAVTLSRDGAQMAVGNKQGKVAVIRQTKNGDELIILNVNAPSPILALTFNHSGNQLAAACGNGTITIWPMGTGQRSGTYLAEDLMILGELEEQTPDRTQKPFYTAKAAIRALTFSPNGKYLAYGDAKGAVVLLDLSNGLNLKDKPYNKDRKQVSCLAFSSDSKVLASGDSEGYVSVWEQLNDQSWAEVALVKAHDKEVTALAFHPDGSVLSSGSKDSTIRQMPLRIHPFDFNRDRALELPEFFLSYYSGTQAVRREKIYEASFRELPYKLEFNKLRPTGDASTLQAALAQFYGGRAPYNAYTWTGELRRKKGSKFWTEWTYALQRNKEPRQYAETGRDENWLYLKDRLQDHRIRVPLKDEGKSVQLAMGESWLDMNLTLKSGSDSVFAFQPGGISFGVDPNRTANWLGFQSDNRGGYNFKISKTDTAFFHLVVTDSVQTGETFQIRIPKKGGWIQYQKGKAWIDLLEVGRWNQINIPVDIAWEGRHFIYQNVSLNHQGNFLEVYPGDDITIDLDWEVRTDNKDGFCPGCIVQAYYGIKDVFSKCYISDGMPPVYYRGDSGHENHSFKAPAKPGIYYITHRFTLDYYCKEEPGEHTNGIQEALAVIRVMPRDDTPPATPEEEAEPSETSRPEKAAMPSVQPAYGALFSPDAFHHLQNAASPRQHIHVENLEPEAGEINPGWWSAMWIIEPVDEAPPYVRLLNRWTEGYLNVENYYLEQGDIAPGWWSAMWELEPVEGTRYIRIKNRWIEGYLNIQDGLLVLSDVEPEAKSGWWLLEKID